jgi:uncharacterized protein
LAFLQVNVLCNTDQIAPLAVPPPNRDRDETSPKSEKAKQSIYHQGDQIMSRICFVELPTSDLAATRSFYADAFGHAFTNYGPSYSCTTTGDVDIGLQGDASEATSAPLVVIAVDDLEATFEAVSKSGGVISKPIFAFHGGRRFHFCDPSRNELAALKAD